MDVWQAKPLARPPQITFIQPSQAVLWGIFPVVLLGATASAVRLWWVRRPLAKLHAAQADPESLRHLFGVHRFSSPWEVSGHVGVVMGQHAPKKCARLVSAPLCCAATTKARGWLAVQETRCKLHCFLTV